MNLDMKKPCKDCPFIPGSSTNTTLMPGRLESIVSDLRADRSFQCHKTLDYEAKKQQHCAGALIFLEREDRPNQLMRVAERFGVYDRHALDMDAEIISKDTGKGINQERRKGEPETKQLGLFDL